MVRRLILAALAALLPGAAVAQHTIHGPITVGTGLSVSGATINSPWTFYAPNYGSCTWDATHDVGSCVNQAITAAVAAGGGTVVLPFGDYGQTVTISQTAKHGVTLMGAGGPGNFGICSTRIKWTGAAFGTQASINPGSSAQTSVRPGMNGICFDANSGAAGTGVFLRAVNFGKFEDVGVILPSAIGWDVDAGDWTNGGTSQNYFINTSTSVAGTAIGWKIGQGSATRDTFDNHWIGGLIQYSGSGDAFQCGSADSNEMIGMDIQPIGGATGISLHLLGQNAGNSCRDNRWITSGGFGRDVTTRPVADNVDNTGTPAATPSQRNTIYQNHDSGAANPLVVGAATINYTDSFGVNYTNSAVNNANQLSGSLKTGLVDAQFLNTLYRASNTNFHHWGTAFDANDSNGAEQTYASAEGWIWSNTAGSIAGAYSISTARAGTLTEAIRVRNNGALEVGAGAFGKSASQIILLDNGLAYASMDNGGTVRPLLQLDSSNRTFLDGGAAGIRFRTNNAAAIWQDVDAGASKVLVQHGETNGIPIHIGTAQTTAPGLGSCGGGTPAIAGTDEAGEVTMGTTATGCVITFNQAYVSAPLCVVTWQATPLASQSYAISNTEITLTQTSTSGNKVNYICRARAGG